MIQAREYDSSFLHCTISRTHLPLLLPCPIIIPNEPQIHVHLTPVGSYPSIRQMIDLPKQPDRHNLNQCPQLWQVIPIFHGTRSEFLFSKVSNVYVREEGFRGVGNGFVSKCEDVRIGEAVFGFSWIKKKKNASKARN